MASSREGSGRRDPARHEPGRLPDKELTRGFPIQIALPDGETDRHFFNPCLRHNGGPEQEAELIRGYLKPPENRCLSEMECENVLGTFSVRGRGSNLSGGCSPRSSGRTASQTRHRYSSSFDGQQCYMHCDSRTPAVDTSCNSLSSVSSLSSMSSSSTATTTGGSPKSRKAAFQMQFLPGLFSPSRERIFYEWETRSSRRCCHSQLIGAPSVTSALADIAVVPCDAASPSTLRSHSDSREAMVSFLSSSVIEDTPPVYSEVLENPTVYQSISRLERRTDSGQI